jgi:hypothetical protein
LLRKIYVSKSGDRVIALFQHRFIIIRFQESCMAKADVMDDLITSDAYILL